MNPQGVILGWSDIVLDIAERVTDWDMSIYIVGGAVRDAFLRRPIKDVDIVTADGGIRLARRMANELNGAFYALDSERDVGRVILETPDGRLIIDVAQMRGDLEADLRARDFTMNAIAVDLRGSMNEAFDPVGGVSDMSQKILRRCSPTSLSDDPIRTLRAVRQASQFGFRIEPETLKAVRENAAGLAQVSGERLRDEFFKLLSLSKCASALRVADSLGVLAQIVPEVVPLHGLEQQPPHIHDAWGHTLAVVDALSEVLAVIDPSRTDETAAQFATGMIAVALDRYRAKLQDHLAVTWADDRPHRALLMLAALLHDVGKAQIPPPATGRRFAGHEKISGDLTDSRAESLRLSNAEKDRLLSIARNHMARIMWEEEPTPLNLHRFWRKTGASGVDLVLFVLADYLGTVGTTLDHATWLHLVERAQVVLGAYYDDYERIVSPPALVTGTDLMERLKLKPGRIIGELLDTLREAQVTGDVTTVEDALALARRTIDRSSFDGISPNGTGR